MKIVIGAKVLLIFDICKFYARIFCVFRFFVVSLHRKIKNTMEELKNELRQIANTPARNISKEQKIRIAEIANSLGVKLPTKIRCGSCWLDTAVECYNKIAEAEKAEPQNMDGRRFILKPNVDVLFGGVRVNAATMTDALAERILARGFERKYFLKCE